MEELKVCFIDIVGLKFTGDTLSKRGIGGSESATIFMGQELTKLGLSVTIYNKCEQEGVYDGVIYKDLSSIRRDETVYDIVISIRSVLPLVPQKYGPEIWDKFQRDIGPFENLVPRAKYKAVWMHDTFLQGEEWLEPLLVDRIVDEVFTLTDWHTHYISQSDHWGTPKRNYDIIKRHIFQTRNGIKYYPPEVDLLSKDSNLFVYNSSITKGMIPLVKDVWPRVKRAIPDAKLVVVGGYYSNAGPNGEKDKGEVDYFELTDEYKDRNDILFTGVIKQHEVAEVLKKATFMIYPPDHPETFSISVVEAMAYGVVPITSRFAALEQTAIEDMSYLMDYNVRKDSSQIDRFVNLVISSYNNKYLTLQKTQKCLDIIPWTSWEGVALQWKVHFYKRFDLIMNREEIEKERITTSNFNRIFKVRHVNLDSQYEFFASTSEKKIVVVSPVYNASLYIENCIRSVAMQIYDNYEHIIIDDMSTDNTVDVARMVIESLPYETRSKVKIVKNSQKKNALWNQIDTIKHLVQDDNAIIALLDGDDWLYNDPDIFRYINDQYNKYEMTYGSCWSLADNIPLIAQEYPKNIRESKGYRNYKFSWGIPYTHLRTFSKNLFNRLDLSILNDTTGNPYGAGGDGALLYALLEECDPDRIGCIKRILVNYNDKNPINDYKVNGEEQNKARDEIQGRIIDGLSAIHKRVMIRDEDAIKEYKSIVASRDDVWVDPVNAQHLLPRITWLKSTMNELNLHEPSILDIGSWTGTVANELHNLGYKDISCVDISKEVVRFGKVKLPYLKWINADIEIYVPTKKYDIIIMMEVMEHLVDPISTIKRLSTYLTPNGRILYTVPTEDCVMDDGKAREHISIITSEDLEKFGDNVYKLSSDDGFEWYCGAISPSNETEDTEEIYNPELKTILIGVPTAKYIETETFRSIYDLIIPKGYKVSFQYFYGYNIAQIRNLMANYTILNKFDYMFWVDSDIVLPPDTLIKLLGHNKDIVSGIYIQRKQGLKIPEIYMWNDVGGMRNAVPEELNQPELMEVAACGFGCVLTSRSVLENIGYPQFEYKSSLDFKDTISEDVDFCIKAFKSGYKVYSDTSIKCDHIGNTVYKI